MIIKRNDDVLMNCYSLFYGNYIQFRRGFFFIEFLPLPFPLIVRESGFTYFFKKCNQTDKKQENS